jgi:hypothetical protein
MEENRSNVKTEIEFAYEKLKANPNIGEKITLLSKDSIKVVFHEYLQAYADDEDMIINESWHWHPDGIDDTIEYVTDIANGDTIFVDNRHSWFGLRMMNKKTFEKKKSKYLSKKNLLIYTGNEIIKRDGETK